MQKSNESANSADYKTILKKLREAVNADEGLASFKQDEFFEKLEQQVSFQNLSYFERYKGLKKTVLILSYLFNFASAFTAAYFVYSLTMWLTSVAIIGWTIAAIFLFFLEQLKRKSSKEVWIGCWFHGKIPSIWLALSIVLLLMSVGASYMGTDTGVRNAAPTPPIATGDEKLDKLYNDKHQLEKDVFAYQQTKWKGVITRDAQKTIKELTHQKVALNSKIDQREQTLGIEKKEVETTHQSKIDNTANIMAAIVVLFEIFFEACICFIWYYYFRSYIERKANHLKSNSKAPTLSLATANVLKQQKEELHPPSEPHELETIPDFPLEQRPLSLNGNGRVHNHN